MNEREFVLWRVILGFYNILLMLTRMFLLQAGLLSSKYIVNVHVHIKNSLNSSEM